ncbi:MAG: aminodeoxychorismate lyase [Methylococcales bacterium]|nr:aminodeoxychorismate lyase [Methylococcales bacterium]
MILVNGVPQTQIDLSDRGLQYGDGLFETIEVLNGQLVFLEQHLQRLSLGCQRLLLPPLVYEIFKKEALSIVKNISKGVLKIIITRGSGGRGYRQPPIVNATRIISLHPSPEYPDHFQQQGIQVRFCQQRLSHNPILAGIKHLNRLEQVLARAEWNDDVINEGIMLDYEGHVIEGTMSNIFFVRNHKLYTPTLTQAGIMGIMRDFLLKRAQKLGITIEEGFFNPQDLLEADALFMSNSIIGIWPVKSLEKRTFSQNTITQQLQRQLKQHKRHFYENFP